MTAELPAVSRLKATLAAVHDHWFEPAPLADLAILRIVLATLGLALFTLPLRLIEWPALGMCWACNLEHQQWLVSIADDQFRPIPAMRVLMLPFGGGRPTLEIVQGIWVAAVTSGILALLGLFTGPALAVFSGTNAFLVAHSYSFNEFHHPEALFIIALAVLALAPSGRRFSLDALFGRLRRAGRGERPPLGRMAQSSWNARWPLRTVQWLLALMYLSAGLYKLRNGGLEWFRGYSLSYEMTRDAVGRGLPVGMWLAQHIPLLKVLSTGSILFELTFALGILLPGLAALYVVSGLAFHASIWVTIGAPFPQVMSLYAAFPDVWRRLFSPWRHRIAVGDTRRDHLAVIYDGRCRLCVRSVVILDALDLGTRLRFIDLESDWEDVARLLPGETASEARHALTVVDPRGGVWGGYSAYQAMSRVLPPLFILAPFLRLSFVNRIGTKVYASVAARRARTTCASGACQAGGVHLGGSSEVRAPVISSAERTPGQVP